VCLLWAADTDAAGTVNAGLGSAPASIERETPRQTVVGYLSACRDGDLAAAAHYLNLSSIPTEKQARQGRRLARRLKIVLDATLWIDTGELSDKPEGDLDDGLPPAIEAIGSLEMETGGVELLLRRLDTGDGGGYWLFHGSTVARIDRFYEVYGFGWLGDHLPQVFFTARLWEVQLWQFCALLLLVLGGWLVSNLLTKPLIAVLGRAARRTTTVWDDELSSVVSGPLRLGILAAFLFVASSWLGLAEPVEQGLQVFWRLTTILILGWLLTSWVGVGARLLERSVIEFDSVASNFIPIFARIAKIGVWALVVVVALDAAGVRVMGLIAGLGIGGLAVAFAAQRTIENFSVRDRILFKTTLGLLYDSSPAQLELAIDEIKKLLYGHPKVYTESVRVRLAGFGDSAINVDIQTWITTTDFNEYTAVAEELYFAILRIVERAGTGFAFPSQTVYTRDESGIDEQRARQADTIVAERRQRGELWLPEPPDEA
jgi:MscS family membrane protein